jgi:hypothetical protein
LSALRVEAKMVDGRADLYRTWALAEAPAPVAF